MTIAEIINEYLEEHDISASELARRSGLSRAYVSMLRNGRSYRDKARPVDMTLDSARLLAKGMGMPLKVLLDKYMEED